MEAVSTCPILSGVLVQTQAQTDRYLVKACFKILVLVAEALTREQICRGETTTNWQQAAETQGY